MGTGKDKVRVGLIGLGARGMGILGPMLLENSEKVLVRAVCDVYEDRCREAADKTEAAGQERPFATTDYHEVLARTDVDAVLIVCSWENHVRVALDAMRAGKPVGMEVGGAYSVEECYELVRVQEATGTPFMFLENCCYGRREMMVMNMVAGGLFGDIVHCNGSYEHDLRSEIVYGRENRHYRLRNYIHRNCENYPTHELGPIAQILGINHGNRMLSLTSTASRPAGLHEYVAAHKPDDEELMHTDFRQGAVVTTVIRCAGGETIRLTLGTKRAGLFRSPPCRGFTAGISPSAGRAGCTKKTPTPCFSTRARICAAPNGTGKRSSATPPRLRRNGNTPSGATS